MSRPGAVAFLAGVAIAAGALLVVAATDERELAFTLGVVPGMVAVELAPGEETCQAPVDVAERFEAVRLKLGTSSGPGSPLVVSVRDVASGATLGAGRLAGGYPDNTRPDVTVGSVPARSRPVAVCVRNAGRRDAALYGGPDIAARASTASGGRAATQVDIGLVFLRERPASALALVPDAFGRAALFRPRWVGAWTFWALAAGVVLLSPALLARAIASSAAAEPAEPVSEEPPVPSRNGDGRVPPEPHGPRAGRATSVGT
jgi:hypothetical protein